MKGRTGPLLVALAVVVAFLAASTWLAHRSPDPGVQAVTDPLVQSWVTGAAEPSGARCGAAPDDPVPPLTAAAWAGDDETWVRRVPVWTEATYRATARDGRHLTITLYLRLASARERPCVTGVNVH